MAKNEDLVNPAVEPATPVEPAVLNPAPNENSPDAPSVLAAHNEPLAEAHPDQAAPETTRHDATDMGVPMLPGEVGERQGPEDALGVGPKRGNYTDRIGPPNYQPHEVTHNDAGQVVVEEQRPRAEDIGDVPGLKGGVETAPEW